MDGQGTKWRRKIAENLKRLSRVHQRYRQTDGRAIAYSEHEREFTFAKYRTKIQQNPVPIKPKDPPGWALKNRRVGGVKWRAVYFGKLVFESDEQKLETSASSLTNILLPLTKLHLWVSKAR